MAYHAANAVVSRGSRVALSEELVRHASASFVQEGDEYTPLSTRLSQVKYSEARLHRMSHRMSHVSTRHSEVRSRAASRESGGAGMAPIHDMPSVRERPESIGEGIAEGIAEGDVCISSRMSRVSKVRATSIAEEQDGQDALPEASQGFLGAWKFLRDDNYKAFLSECVGLRWPILQVAERIKPQPTLTIEDGVLISKTALPSIKSYTERLAVGETTFYEPNQTAEYTVTSVWEDGAVFVSTRQCDKINAGKPITQRRWIDGTTGELVIQHDWGGKRPFILWYSKNK